MPLVNFYRIMFRRLVSFHPRIVDVSVDTKTLLDWLTNTKKEEQQRPKIKIDVKVLLTQKEFIRCARCDWEILHLMKIDIRRPQTELIFLYPFSVSSFSIDLKRYFVSCDAQTTFTAHHNQGRRWTDCWKKKSTQHTRCMWGSVFVWIPRDFQIF